MSGRQRIANRQKNIGLPSPIEVAKCDLNDGQVAVVAQCVKMLSAAKKKVSAASAQEFIAWLHATGRAEKYSAADLQIARAMVERIEENRKPDTPAMLPPDAAASRFMAWLLAHGATGTHTSDQLSALYVTHCQQEALTPVPEAQLRKFLGNGNYPGVHKHKEKSKKHGNRHRPTMWTITDLQPTSVAA